MSGKNLKNRSILLVVLIFLFLSGCIKQNDKTTAVNKIEIINYS